MNNNSVRIQYSAVSTICDKLEIIKNDLIDQWEEINNILKEKDTIWQGEAANRFFYGIYKININAMETTDVKGLPLYIDKVRELIDLNRSIDMKLMEITLSEVKENAPSINSNSMETNAYGVNKSLNESIKANDNINSNTSTVETRGVNKELNDSVKIYDNVKESSTNVEARGIDTDIIDRVSIDNHITN